MSRVKVKIIETTLENEDGREVEGVLAECLECGHTTESFGTGDKSRRRCLVLMRDECPNNDENFYVDEDE